MPKKATNPPKETLAITKNTKIGDVTTYCQELYYKELAKGAIAGDARQKRKQELTDLHKKIEGVFKELNLKCFKCDAAVAETFKEGAELHPFSADEVVKTLNEKLNLDMSLIQEDKE